MALITCPECKQKISDKAAACPHCGGGVPKRKRSGGCLGVLLVVLLIGFAASYFFYDEQAAMEKQAAAASDKQSTPQSLEEAVADYEAVTAAKREKMRRSLFVGSGEVFPLKCYIQDNLMHNPKSYEHVQTEILEEGSWHLLVKTTFRGTNKFGAVVRNTVTAKVHLNGNILEIVKIE